MRRWKWLCNRMSSRSTTCASRSRAAWAASVLEHVVTQAPGPNVRTSAIDRVVRHPLGGSLLFVAVMVIFFAACASGASGKSEAISYGAISY